MDTENKLKLENPIKKANLLSKVFFGWSFSHIRKGTKKVLETSDLYKTLDSDESKRLGDELERNWDAELKRAKARNVSPSLLIVLARTYTCEFMIYGLMVFTQVVVFRSSYPVVLSLLISSFDEERNRENTTRMYWLSAIIIAILTCFTFLFHHHNFGLSKIGMRVRIALSSLVYRKMTRLSQKALAGRAAGQVVSLLSDDVNKFDQAVLSLHNIWIVPFHIVLVSYYLWMEVQLASLVGVSAMVVISLPCQSYLGKIIKRLRYSIALKADERIKIINQVVAGIQIVKMYAWERFFQRIINAVRLEEIHNLTLDSYIKGVITSINITINSVTLCLTVITYVLTGNVITAAQFFSMVQNFNTLRVTMNYFLPMAIRDRAETIITVRRLQEFLTLEERQSSRSFLERNDSGISLTNATASWSSNNDIENMSLDIPPGSICAVVGSVGAGKSSILQLLLGELPLKSGTVSMGGALSYASQEPWLFSATVRNNITFGIPYEKAWYQQVVRICALRRDFDQFPHGDKTIVGERGVALSGGQRARINLARCVYRKADVYLLDDPLSAVDTHISRHLFEECILKHLRGRTRVLVTHQLQYLEKADLVVVVDDGRIVAKGTFEELKASDLDFTKMFPAPEEEGKKEVRDQEVEVRRARFSRCSKTSNGSSVSQILCKDRDVVNTEEVSVPGDRSCFREYLKAANNKSLIVMVVVMMIVAQTFITASDFFVAFLVQQEAVRHSGEKSHLTFKTFSEVTNTSVYHLDKDSSIFDTITSGNSTHHILKTDYLIYIYTALVFAAVVTSLVRSFGFLKICMLSSLNLHTNMVGALLKAPMKFFNTTPSGRILNRVSKDMSAVDNILPDCSVHAAAILLFMLGLLVNVSVSNPYTIAPLVVLSLLTWVLFSWYLVNANRIKLLEGSTKSPVISHVNSTLKGISTVRASKAVEQHICQFDSHQDVHTAAWYLTITLTATFGLWMDILCLIYISIVTFSSVYLMSNDEIKSSRAGLAISQSVVLTGMFQNGMRLMVEIIYQLTSVERIMQYTSLEPEGEFESNKVSKKLLESGLWPKDGQIEIENLYLKYDENEAPVLKNLNFTVQAGEKIGIVGRTGAGKSSIIAALFRLADIEGTILIDGVDTETLGLTDLRNKISIIPQEPLLFSETVRYNLDPSGTCEDSKLWEAIEKVDLKDAVDSLDLMIEDGGSNFSLGQKQLICLARAILKNNKILVLDEATSNVDQRTDAFIQETIRKQFKDCTVLTIAHRLNTIMYCDKILVMNFGAIAEFDHPHELLQRPDGVFHRMVLETGPNMTENLKAMAKKSYDGVDFLTPL